MHKLTEKRDQVIVCESCGKEFSCGVNVGKCWCFEIDLSQEKLAELRENFNGCLCKDCLDKENQPQNNTN